MLTAAGTVKELVDGFALGADDYLAKPFAFAELLARVEALARRTTPAVPPCSGSARSTSTPRAGASPGPGGRSG